MPGSPEMRTSCGWPARASSRRSSSHSRSWCRSTNGRLPVVSCLTTATPNWLESRGKGKAFVAGGRSDLATTTPGAAELEHVPVGEHGEPERDVVAMGAAQDDPGAAIGAMCTGSVAVAARLTGAFHRRELGDEDLLEQTGDVVAVRVLLGGLHRHPPVGPKRSVLIAWGSSPSWTSRFATCSTKPVGPQTNTRRCCARSAPSSRSMSWFTRPDQPVHSGGCSRVNV